MDVTQSWRDSALSATSCTVDWASLRQTWLKKGARAQAIAPWYPALGSAAPAPIPILTDVGGWEGREISWYLSGLSDFIGVAKAALSPNAKWRSKPLLAIPLIGTGAGGQHQFKGDMELALISALREEAQNHDVDFVLVLRNAAAYTSAQAVRRKLDLRWPVGKAAIRPLNFLAGQARLGKLVLFVGAGLSVAAGLPSWSELLAQLAQSVGIHDASLLEKVSLLDLAAIIERRFLSPAAFREKIAVMATSPCFGLGHALIAALPVTERVTTNYDDCIEQSLKATGREPSILPDHPKADDSGWLLKLHGTVGNPQDIVLTRQDYLRYESHRGALFGIVQALLLTRHILFLGFSLRDDNFHVLVDEVRRALEGLQPNEGAKDRRFGTIFIAPAAEFASSLWQSELNLEILGTDESYARNIEIALDYLAFAATSAVSHLLDDSFDAILTDEEHQLKVIVQGIEAKITDLQRKSVTFAPIVKLLTDLGSR